MVKIIRSISNWLLTIVSIVVFIICCTHSVDWKKVRETKEAYPKDTIITARYIFLIDTVTAWINTSYKNYPYKKFNKTRIEGFFDLRNPEVQTLLERDSLELAHLFLNYLRKKGVAHFVFQNIVENVLRITLYVEDEISPLVAVADFSLMNKAEIVPDENWQRYFDLLETIKSNNYQGGTTMAQQRKVISERKTAVNIRYYHNVMCNYNHSDLTI